MTADDFVFAFQRIFDSEALFSPYVDDFSCIKNADAVSKGLLDKSELGVYALSDYTLQIELEYPYYNFLESLTSTAAMPCNKEFFESTKGRYGLSAETTASNGAFYMKEWNYDPYWDNNYIIMRRNTYNSEQDYVYPYSLNFFIVDSEQNESDYSAANIDCIVTDSYNAKLFKESNYNEYSLKSFGLVFNTKSAYFSNQNLRYALASAFYLSDDIFADNSSYTAAYGIVPDDVTVMGRKYREMISDEAMIMYDKDNAFTVWRDTLASQDLVSVDGIKITVPESFTESELLSSVTEQWQQNLDFYCGVEVVSQNEYDMKVEDGSFDIILVEIDPLTSSPDSYFEFFTNDNDEFGQYLNYSASGYLERLKRVESLSEAVDFYTAVESHIIESAVYIPLFYGKKYFVYSADAEDIYFDPSTEEIDFRYAKMFD
jgi:oligopeptide transport system substrate-binding protein